jgi:hypothetical protein
MKAKEITIQFCCKHQDGDFVTKFTKEEKANPLKFAKFVLDIDSENREDFIKNIKKCSILDWGWEDEPKLSKKGVIANTFTPIIKFYLTKNTNTDKFLHTVWESSVVMEFENGTIYFEDNQGYTSIVEDNLLTDDGDTIVTVHQLIEGIPLVS